MKFKKKKNISYNALVTIFYCKYPNALASFPSPSPSTHCQTRQTIADNRAEVREILQRASAIKIVQQRKGKRKKN